MPTTIRLSSALALTVAIGVLAGWPPVLLSQPASDGDTPFALTDAHGQSWPGGNSALFVHRTLAISKEANERLRRFPDSPHTVGWLWQARRYDDALDVLQRVIEQQPVRLPAALSGVEIIVFPPDQSDRFKAGLRSLILAARDALSTMGREQAADVAAALIPIDRVVSDPPVEYDVLVDRVIAQYPDTEAARLLAINVIVRELVTPARLAALEAIAAKQPGTVAAAKARYLKGFNLARNWPNLVQDGANPDPTESFLELLDIVADLESGRYPPCRWVDDAAELVTGYFMFQPEISPENAQRMIDGIVRFASERPALANSWSGKLTFLLTSTMARVAAVLPDGPAIMERQWVRLGEAWPDPAAANLIRAAWLAAKPASLLGPAALVPLSPTREAEIRRLLAEAARSSNTAAAGMALATLAEREFADSSSGTSALAHYREYERRFPSADNTWIAALRTGQAEHALGRQQDAIATFLRVADTYAADLLTRAFALAYAGRIEEERSGFVAPLVTTDWRSASGPPRWATRSPSRCPSAMGRARRRTVRSRTVPKSDARSSSGASPRLAGRCPSRAGRNWSVGGGCSNRGAPGRPRKCSPMWPDASAHSARVSRRGPSSGARGLKPRSIRRLRLPQRRQVR